MPMWAERAGTNEPICASTVMSAFWRRKVDLPAMLGPVTSQMRASVTSSKPADVGARGARQHAVVLDEGAGLGGLQRLLDHGMAAAADLEGGAVVEHGPRVVLLARRARRGPPRSRARPSAAASCAQRLLLGGDGRGELGEHLLLDGERALGGGDDAALGLDQLRRGEAHGAGHGLAVAEGRR